ncbi:MICAL-like protein 1 isoform X2 [Sphaeramia orbicularis]|uniref:MICAL-like protein 1 isoform X2 n=1 Tax=Sphaeramia orbicularis TaxID=375764 RepID=UPI00117C0745|nr:MICAL-like protein 1 isoform X2 [Sphaeramia orbicularis]
MSNLMQEMASPKALRDWCRVTCASYPNVEIKDMSASFRSGLAFCAIIHKHRPDLIEFNSLSKDNIYENNKLAFEVAETKLGIPALLNAKDMISSNPPDCLSVITYLFQLYYFFNRKSNGLASLKLSDAANSPTKSIEDLNFPKSSTNLESNKDADLSNTRLLGVCNMCFKPVHLIQRHLINEKVYHRRCFRCKLCHSSLLPGSYTQGVDANSLVCTHHIKSKKSACVDLSNKLGCGCLSLGGKAITSVPHYIKKTASQDRLVFTTQEKKEKERQESSRRKEESPVGLTPHPPLLVVKETTEQKHGPASFQGDNKVMQDAPKTEDSEDAGRLSACVQGTKGSSRPVPAPRRMAGSSGVPVPAPRTKNFQTMSSSLAKGSSAKQSVSSPNLSNLTSLTSENPRVKSNHPWLNIIHPGPWTQLPPAPAPVPAPRSKPVSNLQGSRYRPKVVPPPPNPFEMKEEEEDGQEEGTPPEPAVQSHSAAAENITNVNVESEDGGVSDPDTNPASGDTAKHLHDSGGTDGPHVTEAQSHILPRSHSVAAISSCSVTSINVEGNESTTTSQSQYQACKENPFDQKPAIPKSQTFQDLPTRRLPAPGHGFPLIKRRVQTDLCAPTDNLQVEMEQLYKHLEALEQRGVDLERSIRGCKNDKEEKKMLMDWFCLVHEIHTLMRRDTELVYLTKQQQLEERQADVEYELRCLLNKPESDWKQEDRSQEQQLMEELVSIIEQRNQIISSLDQDMQREREEDTCWDAMRKKELQQDGLKELKKSKGKFKPPKVFKMLNPKADNRKDSIHKQKHKDETML